MHHETNDPTTEGQQASLKKPAMSESYSAAAIAQIFHVFSLSLTVQGIQIFVITQ